MTIGVGIVGVEIMCGNFGIAIDFGIVGRRNERKFSRNANEAFWVACAGVVGVVAGVVGVVAGVVGVVAGVVGMLVGIVGIMVGMLVGIVGIMVGIVGIGVMTGVGFIGADMVPIDRRARPSSGSTESDALLLVRRRAARWWICSWYGFIGLFS